MSFKPSSPISVSIKKIYWLVQVKWRLYHWSQCEKSVNFPFKMHYYSPIIVFCIHTHQSNNDCCRTKQPIVLIFSDIVVLLNVYPLGNRLPISKIFVTNEMVLVKILQNLLTLRLAVFDISDYEKSSHLCVLTLKFYSQSHKKIRT